MVNSLSASVRPLQSPSAGDPRSCQGGDCGGRPAAEAKCSYLAARWSVLCQISILVGQVCLAAKWSCGEGSPPASGDFEFYVSQLRQVCEWHLPVLIPHAHEWAAEPLWVHYPEGPCRIP